jgi:alanyl-tRNA synthetase
MTERLYYTDSYLTDFEATVVESGEIDGRPYVVLDRSAFYPTSGGQPHDTGMLDGRAVVDVMDREEDGAVLHVLDRPSDVEAGLQPRDVASVAAGLQPRVHGHVDWSRRLDHMQHHTGQHVLSAAFMRTANLPTVSFHLGAELCTIDLAGSAGFDQVRSAEDAANVVVWENRPVAVRFVSEAEAAQLPLRKAPGRGGTLRIVEVADFDLSACGGTHVPRTGVIGAIAVQSWEKYKGGTRVSFVCGGRVIGRFRGYRDTMADVVRQLSIQPEELPAAVFRLQGETRELRQQVRALGEALAGHEADALVRGAEPVGQALVVCRVIEGRDAAGLKSLAQAVASKSRHIAVLVSGAEPVQVVIARADDAPGDAAALLKALVAKFGGRGGGKPEAAQGGGLQGTPAEVRDEALARLSG